MTIAWVCFTGQTARPQRPAYRSIASAPKENPSGLGWGCGAFGCGWVLARLLGNHGWLAVLPLHTGIELPDNRHGLLQNFSIHWEHGWPHGPLLLKN